MVATQIADHIRETEGNISGKVSSRFAAKGEPIRIGDVIRQVTELMDETIQELSPRTRPANDNDAFPGLRVAKGKSGIHPISEHIPPYLIYNRRRCLQLFHPMKDLGFPISIHSKEKPAPPASYIETTIYHIISSQTTGTPLPMQSA